MSSQQLADLSGCRSVKDPDEGYGFPQSRLFRDAATLPILIPGTRIHPRRPRRPDRRGRWAGWLLARSSVGFQIKRVGQAPRRAAAMPGFNETRLVWLVLLLGGALSGLAGLLEVAGRSGS